MKRFCLILLAAVLTAAFCIGAASCSENVQQPTQTGEKSDTPTASADPTPTPTPSADPTADTSGDQTADTPSGETGNTVTPSETGETVVYDIVLKDNGADVGSSGAEVKDGVVMITKAGVYRLTGSTSSGEVIVKVDKTEIVELILAGVTIVNPSGPAIYCDSADKLYVTVTEGTNNTVSDGKGYPSADGPNAAIYSDDDLTIRGTGTLNVKGKYKNGISSKNDLKIKEVTLNVESYNTGIRGKGSVTMTSGVVTIDAGNDGIKSTEETKKDKGYVEITGGTLTITAGDDGIQAATTLTLSGGVVKITADGKKTNAPVLNITDGVLQK